MVPLKVNAEKEGVALAKQYHVQGYPTILFVDAKGELVGKIGGYMPPEGFSEEMAKALKLHKSLPSVLAKLKANPNDPEANAQMVAISAAREKPDQALAQLARAEKGHYKGPALAPAYNAVGDYYQTSGDLDKAIGYFKKADAASLNANDRAYALISLMVCHQGNRDVASAKAVAKRLVALEGAPKEYVQMAQDLLKGG
ncbi:MAG: thioredoxin fold domain-containing protein [Fimbriimonadaceae bacterium]|nr:thioredoxin fold domain-containing protein [Fimbriimonadaceae bacterium]